MKRSAVFLALIVFFAGEAGAAAGRVEFTVGGANVVGADGRTRPAVRGTELDSGDTMRTSDGRVQVRMTDGAYISLQPNTEFGIRNYRFEGKTDGSESAFYSLSKGAMRTVTGLIGRINRSRYQVATPTATVGIRGTGGLIEILGDGSTLVQGTSGIWFLANSAGSIDIPAGVSGLAPADPGRPPRETTQTPTASPTPATRQDFVQGDQRSTTGDPVVTLPTVPSTGSGFVSTLAFGANFDGILPQIVVGLGPATFDGAGRMTQMDLTAGSGGVYILEPGGSHADFGTDGLVTWGRWIGPVTVPGTLLAVPENYSTNQGLHYVVGLPTQTMPQTGVATYTLLGATQPTYIDGSSAPGTFSGGLSVDFGRLTVGMSLSVGMPDGKGYGIGGSAPITGSAFVGTQSFGQGTLTTSGTGGACASGCNALVLGFFFGATAERAGLGYHIDDFTAGKDVVGAAAFKKQ